jgi:prophage DNA circulation protein
MPDALSSLVDASFEGVAFPCSEFSFDGGRRITEHEAHLRDGAVLENGGRTAYKGTLRIPLKNTPALEARYGGELFPRLYERLRGLCESQAIGRLVHPVLGPLRAALTSWQTTGNAEDRGGVELTIGWTEHLASVAEVLDLTGEGSTVSQVQARADAATEAVQAVRPSAPSLRTSVDSATETAGRSGATAEEVRGAFGRLDTAIATARAYPEVSAATAAGYAALTAVERLADSVAQLRERFVPRGTSREYVVGRAGVSVVDVALEAYGSLDAVPRILAANAITATGSLRPGRRLVLPP